MVVMARWMREAGHRVDVVAPEGSETWLKGLNEGLDMHRTPSFSRHLNRGAANRWARGKQADVMWIRDRADLAFAGHASQALGASLIMQQAMQIPSAKNAPWHMRRYRRVDAWVCGLEHLRQECLERTPLEADRCHVLPLPLDDRWFTSPVVESLQAQTQLGLSLPKGTWLVGTVGRLDPGKGQQTALHALAQLPDHVHWVFVGDNTVNNGVYKSGFATSQEAYDEAVGPLFDSLDWIEDILSQNRYLTGDRITEADWRLFTTLARFDLVYHTHFKCNHKRLTDYPNLWAYTRQLYQHADIAETVHFDHIVRHYHFSQITVNPHQIIPINPTVDFTAPHGRD